MRNLLGASLFVLVSALSTGAVAEPVAGPPKPGKKCSISAQGVGAEGGSAAVGLALLAGFAVAHARRARRPR